MNSEVYLLRLCGANHRAPRAAAAAIAMRYPVTICFVNQVLDDLDGDADRAVAWLDAWSSMGASYYVTPSYYKTHLLSAPRA